MKCGYLHHAFGHKLGVPPVNVGLLVRSRGVKDTLSERILSEAEVQALTLSGLKTLSFPMQGIFYDCFGD
jgi:hypothetical protein